VVPFPDGTWEVGVSDVTLSCFWDDEGFAIGLPGRSCDWF